MEENKALMYAVAVALVLFAVGAVLLMESWNPGQIACTMEAKLCPDGSYVGRVPPHCNFAPCPPGNGTGIANPASEYCVEHNGTLEIRDEAAGQAGYCVFANGKECEEWAFFRGECSP